MNITSAIRTLILTLLLIPALTACNNPSGTPDETLQTLISHLKAGELEEMAALTTNPGGIDFLSPDNQNARRLAVTAARNLKVEILETTVTGNTARIRLSGTNSSIPAVMEDILSPENLIQIGLLGGDPARHAQDMLVERVGRSDAPTRTEEVTATLRITRGEWRVEAPRSGGLSPFWSMVFAYLDES